MEVSVEDGSLIKHCRKKRRPITFTVHAQEKKPKGRTVIEILRQSNEINKFYKDIS
jgi:hypothetical protein